MKKFFLFLSFFILIGILNIPSAYAVTLKGAENLVFTDTILDDAYLVAGNGTIESDVPGDLYIAGGQISVNGNINEDLVVAGGKVTVTGNVAGDIRLIGGQVAVYGNVGDDVVAAAGQVDIGKTSVVGGSVVAGAGILTIEGQVNEDVRGMLGMLLLNGSVQRNVIVTVEDTISISKNARIGGNLNYSGLVQATIPQNVVAGEISFNKFEKESVLEDMTYFFFVQKGISYIAALILLILAIILMPQALKKAGAFTKSNIIKTFGVGLLTIISAVIGSIILMIIVVGIPIGLIILSLLIIFLYVAKIFAAAWLASYVLNYKKKISVVKFFFVLAVAMFFYYLLGMLPYAGIVINLILFLIGVGSMVLLKIENWKFLRAKKMI